MTNEENGSYLKWLEEYIENYGFIPTYQIHSKEDEEKINKLIFLYELIENYAKNNNIKAFKSEKGKFYILKYNDNTYKIGANYKDGKIIYTYCIRENIKSGIEYSDISQKEKIESELKLTPEIMDCLAQNSASSKEYPQKSKAKHKQKKLIKGA